jgi:hypothetical protein
VLTGRVELKATGEATPKPSAPSHVAPVSVQATAPLFTQPKA